MSNPGPPTSQGQAYAFAAPQIPTSSAPAPPEQHFPHPGRGRPQPTHQPVLAPSNLPKFHGPPPFAVPALAAHPSIKPELAGGPFLNAPAYRAPHLFPQQHAGAAAFASPPSRKGGERGRGGGHKKQCNCKNSRCLKLYCECFASGRYCEGCNCVNCFNNRENESVRQSAVDTILERNPNAFRPKIQNNDADAQASRGISSDGAPPPRHMKGCNCKKSTCLKKYCECFQAGIYCSDNCKCIDCKNFEGSEARQLVLAAQESAVSAMVLSPAKRSRSSNLGSAPPLLPSAHLPGPSPLHPLPQALSSRGGPLGHIPRIARVQQPHAAPPPPHQAKPIHEMVNMLVKGDTISEVCRLLQMVADDEAAKVNATAADEARALAPDAAATAATAAAITVAEVASEEGTPKEEELDGPLRDAATLQDDCSSQLSSRRVETKERVVMVEFLSVLQSFNAAGQRRSHLPEGLLPHAGAPLPSASQPASSPAQLPPGTRPLLALQLPSLPQPPALALPSASTSNGMPSFLPSASAPFPAAVSRPLPSSTLRPTAIHANAQRPALSLPLPSAPTSLSLPSASGPASLAPITLPTALPKIDLPLKQLNIPSLSTSSAAPPTSSAPPASTAPPAAPPAAPPPQHPPSASVPPQEPAAEPMELDPQPQPPPQPPPQPLLRPKAEPVDEGQEADQKQSKDQGPADGAAPMDADQDGPNGT